jgi:hypothetical protein
MYTLADTVRRPLKFLMLLLHFPIVRGVTSVSPVHKLKAEIILKFAAIGFLGTRLNEMSCGVMNLK